MSHTHQQVGELYDQHIGDYTAFLENAAYSWQYIEGPAFDMALGHMDLDWPNTRILDLGCGIGRVGLRLMTEFGAQPHHIDGIDISKELIDRARVNIPEARFTNASIHDFDLPAASKGLAVSNMVMHYLSDDEFKASLERTYDTLTPGGLYMMVDTDPRYSETFYDPVLQGKILEQRTPWGMTTPYANRWLTDIVTAAKNAGFQLLEGWCPPVSAAGTVEPEKFWKYTSAPSRIATLLRKPHDGDIPGPLHDKAQPRGGAAPVIELATILDGVPASDVRSS